uniref:Uncharacterized protein n=1 Tax=Trichogramma kaykai TaxID=54128 RepID=A0ABD2W3B6_9HYME
MEASHAGTIVDISSSTMFSAEPNRISIPDTISARLSPSRVRALHLRLPAGARPTPWFSSRRISYTIAL